MIPREREGVGGASAGDGAAGGGQRHGPVPGGDEGAGGGRRPDVPRRAQQDAHPVPLRRYNLFSGHSSFNYAAREQGWF